LPASARARRAGWPLLSLESVFCFLERPALRLQIARLLLELFLSACTSRIARAEQPLAISRRGDHGSCKLKCWLVMRVSSWSIPQQA